MALVTCVPAQRGAAVRQLQIAFALVDCWDFRGNTCTFDEARGVWTITFHVHKNAHRRGSVSQKINTFDVPKDSFLTQLLNEWVGQSESVLSQEVGLVSMEVTRGCAFFNAKGAPYDGAGWYRFFGSAVKTTCNDASLEIGPAVVRRLIANCVEMDEEAGGPDTETRHAIGRAMGHSMQVERTVYKATPSSAQLTVAAAAVNALQRRMMARADAAEADAGEAVDAAEADAAGTERERFDAVAAEAAFSAQAITAARTERERFNAGRFAEEDFLLELDTADDNCTAVVVAEHALAQAAEAAEAAEAAQAAGAAAQAAAAAAAQAAAAAAQAEGALPTLQPREVEMGSLRLPDGDLSDDDFEREMMEVCAAAATPAKRGRSSRLPVAGADLLPGHVVMDMDVREMRHAYRGVYGVNTKSGNVPWLFAAITGLNQGEYRAKRRRTDVLDLCTTSDSDTDTA
jgi:hypothetical protein